MTQAVMVCRVNDPKDRKLKQAHTLSWAPEACNQAGGEGCADRGRWHPHKQRQCVQIECACIEDGELEQEADSMDMGKLALKQPA